MKRSWFEKLFLCSVLLVSGLICNAEVANYLFYNSLKYKLVIPNTNELKYSVLPHSKTAEIRINSQSQSGLTHEIEYLLLNPHENLSKKSDETENKNILGMYLKVGYGKLRYNFEGSPVYKFDYEFTKGGGVSLEIPLLTLNERFSIYNELGFSVFTAKTTQHTIDTVGGADPATNYYDTHLTFSPNTITLSNIVRYTLSPNDFKYYIALGIYNSFVVSSTNLNETYHYVNGEPLITHDLAVPDPAVYGLMMLVCTGFSYKNIGFEIRFDPGRSYSNKLNYAVYMPVFDALLHVRFNPK